MTSQEFLDKFNQFMEEYLYTQDKKDGWSGQPSSWDYAYGELNLFLNWIKENKI